MRLSRYTTKNFRLLDGPRGKVVHFESDTKETCGKVKETNICQETFPKLKAVPFEFTGL